MSLRPSDERIAPEAAERGYRALAAVSVRHDPRPPRSADDSIALEDRGLGLLPGGFALMVGAA